MKAKEKKELINKLCSGINPEHEVFFGVLANKESGDYYGIGDMSLLADGIRQLLLKESKRDGEGYAVAKAVMQGVYAAIDEGLDPDFAMDNEEDTEDCTNCELLRVCDSENAIKWRKALGIPKPRKNRGVVREIIIN